MFTPEGRAAAGKTSEADYSAAADLHDYAARLFRWRKGSEAIHHGKTLHFLSRRNYGPRNVTDNTYSFFRYTDRDTVFVYINNTFEPRRLDWRHYGEFVSAPVKGTDVLSGTQVTLDDSLTVAPKSALIVEFGTAHSEAGR